MIDVTQAFEDQGDLDALCAKREDFSTSETFLPNETYGMARVLKEYSGYPLDRPINAVIPHGVYFNASLMIDLERDSGLPAVLNYPAFRAEVWNGAERIVVPSASPFLYALANYRQAYAEPAERSGTLFFPVHTVQQGRTDTDWGELADSLLALEEKYQPVTACVYFVDIWKGLHKPFLERGIKVVSAGNHADIEFLYRWLHLADRHEYALSNDIGSAVLYASKLGLKTLVTDKLARQIPDASLYLLQVEGAQQTRETKRRIAELFQGDPDEPSQTRDEIVDYLLGAENFKDPELLLADLEYVASL